MWLLYCSNPHPLDLIEGDFIGTAVVELGGAGGGVISHGSGLFQRAAVLQISGDPGGTEAVIADPGGDAGARGAGPWRRHWRGAGGAGELLGLAAESAEQRSFVIAGDAD